MHTLRNRILFYGSTMAAGAASLVLHRYMMANCIDAKGLLIDGNLPMKLLWVIAIGYLAFLLPMLTTIGGDGSYEDNFPRCIYSGGLMIAAGLVLLSCISALGLDQPLETEGIAAPWVLVVHSVTAVCMRFLPWLAALSMVVLGICRMTARRPLCIFSGIVCMFYMLMLVTNYRLWSADPKFHEYAYQSLAGVLLMLCSFHRTSCDGGVIQRKKLLFTGLAAAVCATVSLSGSAMTGFYVSGALWAMGCLCNCAVLPPDPEEEEAPAPEAEAPAEQSET